MSISQADLISGIATYWDEHIHDLSIPTSPVGTHEFFKQLEQYRYEKLDYLPRVVDFGAYKAKRLLEIGCGVGIDLLRFARAGANVTGIDLSKTAIDLACKNFEQSEQNAVLRVMDGECVQFADNTFDVVYAHGVLQYTADSAKMIAEIHRVLRPGGEAIMMVYNKHSWLNLMRNLTNVPLEHEDAPVLKKFSASELKRLLHPFQHYRIIPERFPVKTKLHSGWKAYLFNNVFVGAFNLMPKSWIRPFGWHLMAFAAK
jgi:ubiquinone/menaquinone biosynthesis C-methylase UbiE